LLAKGEVIEEKYPSLKEMHEKRIPVNIDNVLEIIGRRRAFEEVCTATGLKNR